MGIEFTTLRSRVSRSTKGTSQVSLVHIFLLEITVLSLKKGKKIKKEIRVEVQKDKEKMSQGQRERKSNTSIEEVLTASGFLSF